jgi:transposase
MANRYTREVPQLSPAESEDLERWTRRPTSAQALAFRARIVLGSARGESDMEVAARLNTTRATVGKWRRRFVKGRCDALLDEPRPGAPREIGDEQIERVIALTLESVPRDATHWSTRSMAKASGMTQSTVSRVWRAFGLRPHRVETFKLSRDPLFIEKVRDVVGLYLNPPERAVALCVDEKSRIQALDRTRPLLPMRPGRPERRTHDYRRHGTTSLFAVLNAATGEVLGECYRRHRSTEFKRFLQLIDRSVPEELDIHLVLDNYGTRQTALIHNYLLAHPRFHLHFTPTSASWLNLVERWFGFLTEKRFRRGTFRSAAQLEQAIQRWVRMYNEDPRPFVWTKTATEILESVKTYCNSIYDSGH